MQLALTILAGFGALLFFVCFLSYVVAGFRHHFITGIISMLPVLNVVTLPSLWDKNSRKFVVGLFGLIIASGAWFMGANTSIQNIVSRNNSQQLVELTTTTPTNASNSSTISVATATQSAPIRTSSYNEENMFKLPKKALYTLAFDSVPINQLSKLQGRIVQITKNDNELVEGRIKSIAPGSVIVNGTFENELPIASIKQLKLMVKKAN